MLKIPRCYWPGVKRSDDQELQLHVFCDASAKSFAAVAFVRLQMPDGVHVSLVASSGRVYPLKPMSIPRLELQAAVLASRLSASIQDEHDLEFKRVVYWSDSKTVLSWIRADAHHFKPFVAHCLGETDERTDVGQWRWVPTKDNVADDAIQGIRVREMHQQSRWFRGPPFLSKPESE